MSKKYCKCIDTTGKLCNSCLSAALYTMPAEERYKVLKDIRSK